MSDHTVETVLPKIKKALGASVFKSISGYLTQILTQMAKDLGGLGFLVDKDTGEFRGSSLTIGRQAIDALTPFTEGGEIVGWNGHYKSGSYWYAPGWFETSSERLRDRLEAAQFSRISIETLARLLEAIEKGELLDEPIPVSKSLLREMSCPFCGDRLGLGFNGKNICIISEKECPHPKGLITEFELNVPSGKLAIANDLREWFPCDADSHDINLNIGCHLTTLDYAEAGMAHGFVGNTCPGVYRNGDNRFVIGNYQKELWDGKARVENTDPAPWGERLAGICTDLWWYSISDYDELRRRRAHFTPDYSTEDLLKYAEVVSVKPGVYKFTQEQGINRDADIVEFASFEWVRDPDPVRDFIKEEATKNWTATEVLIQHAISWPTLYLPERNPDARGMDSYEDHLSWDELTYDQKLHALARTADQCMVTIGSGTEWHENGFPRTKVSEEAQKYAEEFGEIPLFDFQAHWYPISAGYAGLTQAAGIGKDKDYKEVEVEPLMKMAPSFVRLGMNICRNALLYGESQPNLNNDVYPPTFETPYIRQRLKTYLKCYRGLRKHYPEIVIDDAFDKWVMQDARDKWEIPVEEHIETMDLGPDHPPESQWWNKPKTVKTGDYFEIDFMDLDNGNFCWHPKHMRGNASKSNAQRYSLSSPDGDKISLLGAIQKAYGGFDTTIPLQVVGRVLRGTGDGHRSRDLVVAFDYGTPDMQSREWILSDKEMSAVRQFSDQAEYEKKLTEYKQAFDEIESRFDNPKKNTPDYEFVKFRVSDSGKDIEKVLDDDGNLITGKITLKWGFFGESKDKGNNVQGYSYLYYIDIPDDHEIFGSDLDRVESVGWTLLPQHLKVVLKLDDQHYLTTFTLQKDDGHSPEMKNPPWETITAEEVKALELLSLEKNCTADRT